METSSTSGPGLNQYEKRLTNMRSGLLKPDFMQRSINLATTWQYSGLHTAGSPRTRWPVASLPRAVSIDETSPIPAAGSAAKIHAVRSSYVFKSAICLEQARHARRNRCRAPPTRQLLDSIDLLIPERPFHVRQKTLTPRPVLFCELALRRDRQYHQAPLPQVIFYWQTPPVTGVLTRSKVGHSSEGVVMFVRYSLRWSLTLILDAVVFAGVWWMYQTWLGNSEGDALAIAGVVAAIALAPAAWWAGREPDRRPEQPSRAPSATVTISGITVHGPAALQASGTQHNVFNNFRSVFDRNRIAGGGGAVIVLLIVGTLAYTQRIVDVASYLVPLVGILATILSVAIVAFLAQRGFGIVTIVLTSITATAAISGAALVGVWYVQTEPGRSAARMAGDWRIVYRTTFIPDEPCAFNSRDSFGSGERCISGGIITVLLNSITGAVQPAFYSTPAVKDQWYAQVDMRISQGPPSDAACVLMFGYRDVNHWYALRVQSEQQGSQSWSIIRSENAGPLRFYSGPTANQNIDLNSWTSAAIKGNGNSYDFFINNHLIARSQKIDGIQGSINIGTLTVESLHSTTEACDFRDLIVRQR